MVYSPSQILTWGLKFAGCHPRTLNLQLEDFKTHYGSYPVTLADMWFDLCAATDIADPLSEKEKGIEGLKHFLIAHFFLWVYPRNMNLVSSRFKVCVRYLEGEFLWRWPRRIQSLNAKKIIWPDRLNGEDTAIFQFSLDDVDTRCTEKKHP
jgi:hypothetical protein